MINRIKWKLNSLYVRACGTLWGKFYCPSCEKKVAKWKAFKCATGDEQTIFHPGKLCPHCDTFARTRHFSLYIKQNDIIKTGIKMLHFAPENGLSQKLRLMLGDGYITTDLCRNDVDSKEDMCNLSFEDNFFDIIYCSHVLEHIVDDTTAMSELFRVIKPGGQAFIQVPINGKTTYEDSTIVDPHDRFKHFGQFDHVRCYGEDISIRLENAGFKVIPFYMLDVLEIDKSAIARMNIDEYELIHKCIKMPDTVKKTQ